jgi:hypothetical protein
MSVPIYACQVGGGGGRFGGEMAKAEKTKRIPPRKVNILVLGEFGRANQRIQNLKDRVSEIIKEVKSTNGLQLATVRFAKPRPGRQLLDEIKKSIQHADIVIIDISTEKPGEIFNTNSIYELGFVQGLEFTNQLNGKRNTPVCYTLV